MDRPNTGGGARIDQITRTQMVEAREMGNHLGHRPNHVGQPRLLCDFIIVNQTDRLIRGSAKFRGQSDRREDGSLFKILTQIPGAAFVFGGGLQVAAGQINATGIAEHSVQRLGCRGLKGRGTKGNDKFHLVMHVTGAGRIGNIGPAEAQRVGRLGEIERRFAVHLVAHLGGMGSVVAPDAENSAHRIALIAARDRHKWRGGY